MPPLIIAHRGASGHAPENTLKAFQLALDMKADGIELDIFLTQDGHVVVTHDEHLERLTGKSLITRQSSLAELRTLDFGQGEKIPLLADVFDLCASRVSVINVEIKSTGFFTDGIEKKLVDLIRQFKLSDKVLVSSFNPLHLYRLEKLAPEIRRGCLICPESWWGRRDLAIRLAHPTSINTDQKWCRGPRFEHFKRLAPETWVWTVNTEEDMKYWVNQGVKAIITNTPDRLYTLLARDLQ